MATKKTSVALLIALLFLVPSALWAIEDATVERVLDDGTMVLTNGDIVKYAGVAIPIAETKSFKEAAGYSRSLLEGADVKLEFDLRRRDEEGNLLAYVYVDKVFVNLELVRLGFAEVDTATENTRYRRLFFQAQKKAFEMGRGLWAERFGIPPGGEKGVGLIELGEVAPIAAPSERGVPLKERDMPPGPIPLGLGLYIGDALTYSVAFSQSTSGDKADGGGMRQSGEMTLTYRVEDILEEETLVLAATITGIDSYSTDEASSSEEMASLQGIVGKGVRIRMGRRGGLEVSNVGEQILPHVSQPHLQSLLLGLFSTDFPLADHPVNVGTFWFHMAEIPLEQNGLAVTLLGQVKYLVTDLVELDGRPCVRIDKFGELSGPPGEGSQMEGMISTEGSVEGSLHFDFREGIPVMADTTCQVSVSSTDQATKEQRGELGLKRRIALRLKEVTRGENYISPEVAAGRPPFKMYVKRRLVNVRGDSGTDSSVVNQVKAGQPVEVLAKKGNWYKVELEKTVEGWIRGDLLSGEVPAELIPSAEGAAEEAAPQRAAAEEGAEISVAEPAEKPAPEGMVFVPAGAFTMGSDEGEPNSAPAREVHLEAFYLDKYEVTNAQYKGFHPDHVFPEGKEGHPVVDVAWEEADQYCRSVGKRLPTEEEWENGARGVDGRRYPWGDEFSPERANTIESGIKDTTPVGNYPEGVSYYGAYDMAGNAAEWTAGYYQAYPGNQAEDPDYGESFRVLRGGSWFNTQLQATAFARMHDSPNSRRSFYGFRCAVSAADVAEKEAAAPAEAPPVAKEEAKPSVAERVKAVQPVEEEPENFFQYMVLKVKRSVGGVVGKIKGLIGRGE